MFKQVRNFHHPIINHGYAGLKMAWLAGALMSPPQLPAPDPALLQQQPRLFPAAPGQPYSMPLSMAIALSISTSTGSPSRSRLQPPAGSPSGIPQSIGSTGIPFNSPPVSGDLLAGLLSSGTMARSGQAAAPSPGRGAGLSVPYLPTGETHVTSSSHVTSLPGAGAQSAAPSDQPKPPPGSAPG